MELQHDAPFEQYLSEIEAQLQHLSIAQRDRIQQELYQHLADAAHNEHADIHDHAFQHIIMQRLGDSRQLGCTLARANRPQRVFPYQMQRLSGYTLFLSGLLVALAYPLGLMTRSEQVMMGVISGAPSLLMIAVISLCALFMPLQPHVSRMACAAGLFGFGSLWILSFWHHVIAWLGLEHSRLHVPIDMLNMPLLTTFWPASIIAWFIMVGWMSGKTHFQERTALSTMSYTVAGSLFGILVMALVYNLQRNSPYLMAFQVAFFACTIIWMICHVVWCLVVGAWLLKRPTLQQKLA